MDEQNEGKENTNAPTLPEEKELLENTPPPEEEKAPAPPAEEKSLVLMDVYTLRDKLNYLVEKTNELIILHDKDSKILTNSSRDIKGNILAAHTSAKGENDTRIGNVQQLIQNGVIDLVDFVK